MVESVIERLQCSSSERFCVVRVLCQSCFHRGCREVVNGLQRVLEVLEVVGV